MAKSVEAFGDMVGVYGAHFFRANDIKAIESNIVHHSNGPVVSIQYGKDGYANIEVGSHEEAEAMARMIAELKAKIQQGSIQRAEDTARIAYERRVTLAKLNAEMEAA